MKKMMTVMTALFAIAAGAAEGDGAKLSFLKQQAFAEMQRVTGQIDVLQTNHDDLSSRVAKLEGGGGELKAVKAEVDAMKAEIDQLRRDMQRQRKEIVDEITKKVVELMKASNARAAAAAAAAPAPAPAHDGPCQEYFVVSGDTLSLIAQAFKTSVAKLKSMNGLKSDNLRIGQRLLVPKAGK